MIVRPLAAEDHEQSWRLSALAFGGDPRSPAPEPSDDRGVGAFDDDGRMVGRVIVEPLEQWWVGRPVAMAGIAGVVVHPDARGSRLVGRMLSTALADEPVSALFPTAPGIYRSLGWEVVGHLDWTPVPLTSLPEPTGTVRGAREADLPTLAELYAARAAAGSGLLTRTRDVLRHDVVSVAVEDGRVTGYVAYSRGAGYDGTAELKVWDCVAATPTATQALLGSLRTWSPVAGTALWRGPTAELGRLLGSRLPPARTTQPWMLRVVDPVAAVAARGFVPGSHKVGFSVAGQGYCLAVADGRGELTPVQGEGLPELSPRGLALLYAGVGWSAHRTGHASRPVPELEAAFAGPTPEILDYF